MLVGLAIVLAAAAALIARQPIGRSWARYADADAIYVGSGISILDGERTKYFDHPGMPLQALAALSFGVQYGVHAAGGGDTSLHTYAKQTMLDLDRTRVWFRGWAIVLYLAGAALSFVLVARLLGSVLLGTVAGLAWVAAPGIGAMSIQFRPDVALTALCVVLAYLIATGAERRDAGKLALAAFVLGVTMTVKVHAAGMMVPLALAAIFRSPAEGWWRLLAARVREVVAQRRAWVAMGIVAWVALVLLLNVRAWPFGPAASQRVLVIEIVAGLAAYWLAAVSVGRRGPAPVRAVLGPFPAFLLTLVLLGIAVSLCLVVSDAGIALQSMKNVLTGQGVNAHISLLHKLKSSLSPWRVVGVAAFAVLTCAVAYRRKVFWPVVVLAGAVTMAAMASGRGGGYAHYFAPAFMPAVIVGLWLVGTASTPLLSVAAVFAAVAGASLAIAQTPSSHAADACATSVAQARQLLRGDDVALAPRALWLPDIEYQTIVETYVELVPPYPFAFVRSDAGGLATAKARGLRPRYAVDPSLAKGPERGVRTIGTAGRYSVRVVYRDRGCGVAAIEPV
jgi:hypothetical protein